MDLSKIRKADYQFDMLITSHQARRMRDRETIVATNFTDTKSMVEIYPLAFNRTINFHVGNVEGEDGRCFFDFKATLSNGMVFEKKFWHFEIIEMMSFRDLSSWKTPRKISIVLKVGIYEGEGSSTEWQEILEDIDDFTPVCSPRTFHSQRMEQLLDKGYYSDITFKFPTGRELLAHKCILMASSLYFRVLFSGTFVESQNNAIDVNFDFDLMRLVVLFLYTGQVNDKDVKNWPDVYSIARFYDINVLAKHAELQMMANAPKDIEEIKNVLRFAVKCQAFRLKKFMVKYTRKMQETKETRNYHEPLFWLNVRFI